MWRTQPGRVASCTRIYSLPQKNKVPSCEYLRPRTETYSLELCDRPAFFCTDNIHVASLCGRCIKGIDFGAKSNTHLSRKLIILMYRRSILSFATWKSNEELLRSV